jgi:hypothetical protein
LQLQVRSAIILILKRFKCADRGTSIEPAAAEADHRQGWKRQSSNSASHYRFDSSPCSELKLDAEMTMFESQITRTVSDHLSHLTSLSPSSSTLAAEAAAAAAGSCVQKKLCSGDLQLKRKRSSESDMQVGGILSTNTAICLIYSLLRRSCYV